MKIFFIAAAVSFTSFTAMGASVVCRTDDGTCVYGCSYVANGGASGCGLVRGGNSCASFHSAAMHAIRGGRGNYIASVPGVPDMYCKVFGVTENRYRPTPTRDVLDLLFPKR